MNVSTRSGTNRKGARAREAHRDDQPSGADRQLAELELKRPLPEGRTLKQLRNHYLVERELARQLMAASREERKSIYATMYDDLFSRVPDHPRLTQRDDDRSTEVANQVKMALVSRFLDRSKVFLEYAPGDCRFAIEVARHVRWCYGVDISDQRRPGERNPENFELIVYDGYNLDQLEDGSVDLVFSDQLIEHFHPEDTGLHFRLVHRILKHGGVYLFRTPHALTGPHDVSQFFSDVPECFHLKEWTYREIAGLLGEVGFSGWRAYWGRRRLMLRMPRLWFLLLEKQLDRLPKRYGRELGNVLVRSVLVAAVK